MSAPATSDGGVVRRSGRWIDDWRPEDEGFWRSTGKRIANRNLWFSVFSEHIGFSIWSLYAVLTLFMGPAYHIDTAGKFFLVSMPTLIGSFLRLPYSMAVAVVGGRNWTIISAALLLIPSIALAVVMHPGTSYTTFMVVGALAGVGGGNFASSMTNINAFFPEKEKGKALGLNAGGGNLGVAVIQLVGLLIIATAGTNAPRIVLAVYIPLIVLALLGAVFFMDNLSTVRNDGGALAEAVRDAQTWIISFLYIGTFGSFIGFSFAFGLVLQNQFGRTPLQAAAITFIGPLLGSLVRPVGGWLSDRFGGTKISFWNFVAMAVSALICIGASGIKSLPLFVVGFVLLFVTSGLGNGSVYKMIPAVFRTKALARSEERGWDQEAALLWARRISGAVIGIAGAIGAFGGLLINLAFRASFQSAAKSGVPAFWTFVAFYAVCFVLTYLVYMRNAKAATDPKTGTRLSYAEV